MEKKIKPAEGYFDHLEVLRWKIIFTLLFFCASAAGGFFLAGNAAAFIEAPARSLGLSLYYFKPWEKFTVYMKAALVLAFTVTLPFAMVQAASFILPALRKGEKRWLVAGAAAVPVFLAGGAAFAYYLIVPGALRFLISFYPGAGAQPLLGLSDYYDFTLSLMTMTGLVFLIPAFLLVIIRTGLVSTAALSKARGGIIIGIAVLSAIITPPDVASQFLVGVPLYALFEITLLAGRLFEKKTEAPDSNNPPRNSA